MISLSEINEAAKRYDVTAEIIEKDYIISWILFCFCKSKLKNDFIFYGGTAIKRIYFEEHRFSEDIDLISSKTFTQDYLLQELDVLRLAYEEVNLELAVDRDNVIVMNDRVQLYVRYSGYNEIIGAPKEIRLDFVMGRDVPKGVVERKIIASYSDVDVSNHTLSVMTLNTILANKIGLLMDATRNEPRDLFDIWFLLDRTDQYDFDWRRVCEAFREKYGFYPAANILVPLLRNRAVKMQWLARLAKQIAQLPAVDDVIKDIELKLICLMSN